MSCIAKNKVCILETNFVFPIKKKVFTFKKLCIWKTKVCFF